MVGNRTLRAVLSAASLAGCAALACPAALAAPPAAQNPPTPGTWRLIPVQNDKVPAAWVINTETGETYLCGSGAANGRARVACIEASFPKSETH